MQKKFGKDNLEVLLLSVDQSYGSDKGVSKKTRKREKKIYEKLKLDWSNVHMEGGWTGIINEFNLHGYSLTLIDANGIVCGVNIHARDAKKLLRTLYPLAGKGEKGQGKAPKVDER